MISQTRSPSSQKASPARTRLCRRAPGRETTTRGAAGVSVGGAVVVTGPPCLIGAGASRPSRLRGARDLRRHRKLGWRRPRPIPKGPRAHRARRGPVPPARRPDPPAGDARRRGGGRRRPRGRDPPRDRGALPDLALLDVRLPPSFADEGLRAALEARRRFPGLPVLLLSQYVEQLYVDELLADGAGGVGYLLKDRVFDDVQFVSALRTVAAGGTAVDPEVVRALMQRRSASALLDRLTPRELEVLALMAEGEGNTGIAERLVVTEKAVAKHINSILTKLDLPASATVSRRVVAVLTYLRS
ncbi:LuxR C-terminal-related transcriptional regulator [Luteimicrobium album]|uniref:LuxR C-terminal-related transcriptional regulator n=1 Tax=Luteimicrobium album TaxID=1054550 RepID=UPI003D6788B0